MDGWTLATDGALRSSWLQLARRGVWHHLFEPVKQVGILSAL